MGLPNAKGRRPPPVKAVGLTPLPGATGPQPSTAGMSSPSGASTGTDSQSPSPSHPGNKNGGGDTVVSTSPSPAPTVPAQVSASSQRYSVKIVAQLGAGAAGEISVINYEDTAKNKSELRVMKEMDNRNKVKCEREKAQFNRQSCHPNMIKYYYYGPACTTNRKSSHTQVQMELMDLGSLKQVLQSTAKGMTQEDRFTVTQTVGYQIFMALDYFHFFHGGMHRDVKPDNILVNLQGRAKLCDFDASVADSMIHDTACGTTSYAAPEVIQFKSHDFKCDIWSAGTVLFELAAGKHPYMSGGSGMIGGMIAAEGNISDSINWDLVKHMGPSFIDLLKHCLTEDQAARYSSADAILHPFFEDINKGRRRDVRAETQLKKLGIDVDPEATQKMHLSWRNFVQTAEGGGSFASASGGGTPTSAQRTASSLGEEEADALNQSQVPGSPLGGTLNESTSEPPVPGTPVPGSGVSVSTPSSATIHLGGLAPGSPEAKEKAMKVSNVMKSILYNWEHASVTQLAAWLKTKRAELNPVVTPEQLKAANIGSNGHSSSTPHS